VDNQPGDTRLTDPVTTPFDDIRIAQQHYGREKNVETLPATSQKQKHLGKVRNDAAWRAQ